MKKRMAVAGAILLLGSMASGQNNTVHTVDIADTGAVVRNRTLHVRKGHTIAWRHRTGSRTWYVNFPNASPCSNGKEFGHDRTTTCTVTAGPGTYHYRSALNSEGTPHDPDVIVDQ